MHNIQYEVQSIGITYRNNIMSVISILYNMYNLHTFCPSDILKVEYLSKTGKVRTKIMF